MFYAESTGGFYHRELHGDAIPADAVEITNAQHAALMDAQASGKQIEADAHGHPVAVNPPERPLSEMLERAQDELRTLRRDMLDAVTGIGFRAGVNGNLVLAGEAAAVSQQLLDITKEPDLLAATNYPAMRAAGLAAYRRIASAASPELRSAFNAINE